jgi:NAD(P)-dependent dehydrogenase (short-subunit alcohol dehydrogenase family)
VGRVKDLEGKVAVVTGAAGGIGRALARLCAEEGMKVVLADVEPAALTAAEVEARNGGAEVLGVLTDVSNPDDVERLARSTLDRFGAVHVLFNNAGVAMIGPALWETTVLDWNWILGVNLWGLIHGLRIFVPIMIEQAAECHIVNTASAAGLLATPGMGAYDATKAALIALSEALRQELALRQASIGVSVLCPGFVRTGIVDAARNRPTDLRNESWVETERRERHADELETLRRAVEDGMAPEKVAASAFRAIRNDRLHVFTDPRVREAWELRVRDILRGSDS